MAASHSPSPSSSLIDSLHSVLLELNARPYPDVACPPGVPKRASVALVIRVQPQYNHWPAYPDAPASTSSHTSKPRRRSSAASAATRKLGFADILRAFFDQDWVKHGDPEILFIKRATRVGDKWNGHVALPGGKRDPEDDDDAVTAMREALEEVGIDLSYNNAIAVGNLPQRIVTTSWGKVPLMVLCPYIYLLTSPSYPSQRLQPTEVASSHWVPIRALLSPALRTHEYADVSARLSKSELGIKRWFLQSMLSQMMFAAIRLEPSHSTHCASIPGFVPVPTPRSAFAQALAADPAATTQKPPLLLWGLTLGVVSDFLEHIPPHNALELWTYPTFTSWDVRFALWALSCSFRAQKAREMSTSNPNPNSNSNSTSIPTSTTTTNTQDLPGLGSEGVGPLFSADERQDKPEVGIAGLGVGSWGQTGRAKMLERGSAVNGLLEGYYPLVRRAVALALAGRVGVFAALALWAWTKYARGWGWGWVRMGR